MLRRIAVLALLLGILPLLRGTGKPLDLVRLREAEAAFREVHQQFLDLRMDVLLSEQGRTRELKDLSVELLSAFEAREIHRESLAVLLLFQRACEEERLTAELARQLASLLRKSGSR